MSSSLLGLIRISDIIIGIYSFTCILSFHRTVSQKIAGSSSTFNWKSNLSTLNFFLKISEKKENLYAELPHPDIRSYNLELPREIEHIGSKSEVQYTSMDGHSKLQNPTTN
jgi:hypothetical protein